MLALGLSAARMRDLVRALGEPHAIDVTVQVLDTEHRLKGDVSARLVGGQVDKKGEGRFLSSTARVELFDPNFKTGFDTDTPRQGQLFADRMIRIIYSVQVSPGPDGWVSIPLFTGPIAYARRDGPFITVDCVGKEAFADRASWDTHAYKSGTLRVDVIRWMLYHMGESSRYMDFPVWKSRTGKQQIFVRETNVWRELVKLAGAKDALLFYDARGVAQLRRTSQNVVFTMRDGSAVFPGTLPMVMGDPSVEFDTADFKNVFHVTGSTDRKGGKPPEGRTPIPRDHQMSAWRLGRRDKPRILAEFVTDSDVRTNLEARTMSAGLAERQVREYQTVAVDTLVAPFLEPLDLLALHTKAATVPTFRIREMSIPLTHEGVMSLGTLKHLYPYDYKRRLSR